MAQPKTRFTLIAVFTTLALVAAFAVYRIQYQPEIFKAKRGEVVESIYGLGTVTADRTFHLRTAVSLSVRKLWVTEGQAVIVGQPLIQLDEQVFKSPIAGTVTMVAHKEGEIVPPQVPIVTVTNLQNLYLEVSLEQQSILRVKKGQSVWVTFESLRNERSEGVVESVFPRDVQFIVRISLKDWPEGVLPGMTADVAILVGKKTGVTLIPIKAIHAGRVTRLRNGKKETLSVKLGAIDGEWAEVTSEGIESTDELVGRSSGK